MNYKYSPAKHVTQKFTVKGVNAYFYATSEKTMMAFLKKENLKIEKHYYIKALSTYEQNRTEKIARAVWKMEIN